MCNWYPAVDSNYEWRQQQGPIPGNVNGPDVDHTFGTKLGKSFRLVLSLLFDIALCA